MATLHDTAPKKFVFVLMPFDSTFQDVYEVGIKPACRDAGAYCERVDEQIFHESILERVYKEISKADLIVADMTGRNPNVFYEVGYAHALAKKTILLTRESDDIPFDLKHYHHIVYGNSIATLKNELERRVKWYLDQPDIEVRDKMSYIECYIGKNKVADQTDISIDIDRITLEKLQCGIEIAIHNTYSEIIDFNKGRISITLEKKFRSRNIGLSNGIMLPSGHINLWKDIPSQILPDSWELCYFSMEAYFHDIGIEDEAEDFSG